MLSLREQLLRLQLHLHRHRPLTPGHPVRQVEKEERTKERERVNTALPVPDLYPPTDYATALRAVADLDFLKSEKHRNQHMRADRKGAHEHILRFEKAFLNALTKAGVPAFAHCVIRDRTEQERVFAEGFSMAKYGQSAHNYGCAVDIIHATRAWGISDMSWKILGHLGKEIAHRNNIPVVWGGDFKKPWDPAHWELANWREIVKHRALISEPRF